ncbi:MAG: hypothetical protein AAFU67_04050 [Bacteroidota bacterium]
MPQLDIYPLTSTEVSLIQAHRRLVNSFDEDDPRRVVIAAQHRQCAEITALMMQSIVHLTRLQSHTPLPPLKSVKEA